MTFYSYPEIENSYRQKSIDQHLEYNPGAKDVKYIVQYKYDGSNIQFVFEPYSPMKIASRKRILAEDEDFQGLLSSNILHRYQTIFDRVQEYCDTNEIEVNLYGEFFGKGIQNRIDYGPDKYIYFFDGRLDGKMLVFSEFKRIFPYIYDTYFVPTLGYYSFDEIFELPVPEGHEGIVIKQFDRANDYERLLFLKKKDEKFEEKMKSKKKKEKKPEDPEVTRLKEEFLPYINENRVLSVFSKEGEIQEPSQIGNYIKLVMEDAIKEFEKEVDTGNIDRSKLKQVYKSGNREVVTILNKYL